MNKNFKTLMTMTLACLMLCGTVFAAPRGGHGKGRAPEQPRRHQTAKRTPAPKHRTAERQTAKKHHAPKHQAKHHKARHHHGHDKGWVTFGAAAIGGLVGGIIGACR